MTPGKCRRARRAFRFLLPGLLLLGATLTVSCGGDSPAVPAGASLEGATYLTENTREGTATLEDGEFRQPVAPGSADLTS